MALAGRSPRRAGGGRRILVLAVLITLVVLLVDASIKSRSPGPVRQLAAEAWIDQALPLIRDSTVQGQQITEVATDGLQLPAASIARQANQTARAAKNTYEQATKLAPPPSITAAAGLLDACFLVRSQAASSVAKILVAALSGPATQAAATTNSTALAESAQSFEVADKAYQLFSQNLPPLGVAAPSSAWVTNAALFQNPRLAVYLQALRNATNLAPTHQLEVVSVSTEPQAESLQGTVQVLPPSSHIAVALVVANVGNQTEHDLTVTATIAPALKAPSVRDYITTLAPGNNQAMTIGPLYPPVGQPVTLTVTVNGLRSSPTAPASQVLTFEMPGPNTALSTTTTTAAAPAGTVPTTVAVTSVPASTTTTAKGG